MAHLGNTVINGALRVIGGENVDTINGVTVGSSPKFTDTNTLNTAGSTNTSSKIFLIGATSQAANPQTYSDDQVYTTSGTLTSNKVDTKAIIALTGSGTAGQDKGSGVSPRYIPALWVFNSGITVANGEVYFIKIPVAGGTWGVWLSLNNGSNYYPVAVSSGTTRFTTHYAVNTVIAITYESASKCSCYARTGADSLADVTGIFRVLNDYDANTTYSAMSSSELTTGTATTSRVVRADYLKTGIDSLIDTKIGNLDATGASGIAASKTISAWSETDGKVSITTQNISITKSQVSDFPTSMTPTSHTHGNIQNGGTLQTNDITIANGDKLVVTDSSDSSKIARTSVSFDGSTTTKALTQKGTFETFATTNTDRYVNSAAFADDTTSNANNPVKMTLTRAGSDTAKVTGNIPKVSSSSAGVAPKGAAVSTQSQTTKFLREDGSWAAPTYTTNTDAKVTQTADDSTDSNFEVLFSGTANNTTLTEGSRKSSKLRYNANKGSFMEGTSTVATGTNAHAEGSETSSTGICTHAEGQKTSAYGDGGHAEGYGTSAYGNSSHAEGTYTSAANTNSHAEGSETTSSGTTGHSEGTKTAATGHASHAEGLKCTASGNAAHAEGYNNGVSTNPGTIASGHGSHSEGCCTTASGDGSHAEGGFTLVSGTFSNASGYNTRVGGNYAHAEGQATTVDADNAHAEGLNTFAGNVEAHAEGYNTSATGIASHAEGGYTTASSGMGTFAISDNAHAEGLNTTASGKNSHAEGQMTKASSSYSHAEGYNTGASGAASHAEGTGCIANNEAAHAEGKSTKATNTYAHAEGNSTTAAGTNSHSEGNSTYAGFQNSHAEGYCTSAMANQTHAEGHSTCADNGQSYAMGHRNAAMVTGGSASNTNGTAFVIGNGTSASALKNAFSVQFSGAVKAASTITASTTADYAEYFEWADENPNNEDRVGYFVTFDSGDKIKIGSSEDEYILGIVSGEPFVLGNGDCDVWNGMVMRDAFRRTIYEPAPKYDYLPHGEAILAKDKNGKQIYEGTKPKYNPNYDPTQPYINRADRPEWSAVGMLGVLAVRDNGQCQVNSYCTVGQGGIAVPADINSIHKYRVIKRNATNVVEVVFR